MGEGRLATAVLENLDALLTHRAKLAAEESADDRRARWIAERIGTMRFAYLHGAVVAAWILWNGVLPVPRFDPYPFVMLAMCASVEAIFLSTFVLVNQARMARLAESRAELDVQIGLLAERETTRVLALVSGIAARLGVASPADVAELVLDTDPKEILAEIERAQHEAEHGR